MSSLELDSTLLLPTQTLMEVPAEEIACVVCSSYESGEQLRTVFVVDVNPTSRTYSEIVGEIALQQPDEPPRREGRGPCVFSFHAGLKIAGKVLLAHKPEHSYGFSSSGFSIQDLSSAVSIWYRDGDPDESKRWSARKVIQIPAEPNDDEQLPELLRTRGAVPALVTDVALSLDDRLLYVACWGTGYFKQFDVSDPFSPREIASIRIGGIASQAAHPSQAQALSGGPCSITLSRDGRRAYLTNSLCPVWNEQLFPNGFQSWIVKLDIDPRGGLDFDPNFFVDLSNHCPRQVRLQGQGLH